MAAKGEMRQEFAVNVSYGEETGYEDLEALEQAIIEICDVVTATKIMMRKKEILKR